MRNNGYFSRLIPETRVNISVVNMLAPRLFSRTFLPRTLDSSRKSSSEVSRFLSEQIVSRKNGIKEKRLFSDSEYERRLANLR